jgi:hypothetical protein
MRNVKLNKATGITVGIRKNGDLAVLWDHNGEIEWYSAEETAKLTITPRH